jgi:hypothetical protein
MRPTTHEIYGRRRSRNLGLGLTLAGFVLIVFMVTIVKLNAGHAVRGIQIGQGAELPPPAAALEAPAPDATHIPSAAERAAARAADREAPGD